MPSYRSVPPKPRAPEAPASEPAPDLSELKKAELVALAEERGLGTSGTKADIVERLDE